MVQMSQPFSVEGTPMVMDRYLTSDDVQALIGVSKSTLYRVIRTAGFPRPIALSPQIRRWSESEVRSWITERPRALPEIGESKG